MNFVLSALVLALLLLPGGLFRYGYLRFHKRGHAPSNLNLSDNLGWLLAGTLAIQALAVWLLNQLGGTVRYDLLLPMLTGQFGQDGRYLNQLIAALPISAPWALLYVAATSFGAYTLGAGLSLIVSRTNADLSVPFLRFPSEWNYTLDSEANAITVGGDRILPDVYFSTVVELKDHSYLYRGIIDSWMLDDKGNLDRVALLSAHRRRLDDDRPPGAGPSDPDSRYYPIAGDLLFLRMGECKTVNVQYTYAIDTSEVEVDVSADHEVLDEALEDGSSV